MGSTIIEQDFPHDIIHRGQRDANRHNKRINDAVKKQLKDIISQQDIITSEGNKKIKVRLKYLDQYRFRQNPDRLDVVGRDEFDELSDGEIISEPSGGGGLPAKAGDAAGEELYETEYTIEELTDMMIEELELPDLDETKKNEIVSDVLEYTDRRKRTGIEACLDKKQTLLAHIKRRSQLKKTRQDSLVWTQDDLRFKTWEVAKEKYSNAVIFLMMDRSGSMWESKIYSVKALYFWLVQFLRRKYDKVVIKFIAHDYYAKELNEKEFFTIADSGGTRVSAAYEMCREMIKHNYPSSIWNIYCFHASDGDSWGDEAECVDLAGEILKLGANLFAYTEIDLEDYRDGPSQLYSLLKRAAKKKHRRLVVSNIQKMEDILDTLRKVLRHSHSASWATV
jgi:sporulation protein YhbH